MAWRLTSVRLSVRLQLFAFQSNMDVLAFDCLTHFQLLLKNCWRDLLQTWHKYALWNSDHVLLLVKSIRNPIWRPWPLVGWHIFNFFSKMSEGFYSKLGTNVPHEVPTKCCYFLSRSIIRYGRPVLWLSDTFSTSSQERLKGSTSNLAQIFLLRSWTSVVTFYVDQKYNMATLAFDLLTYKKLIIFRTFCFKFLSEFTNNTF